MAEIGDKTQLLSFVLAARLRKPWPIIGGILVATLANHALAGWAGSLLAGLVPQTPLIWIVGLSFIAFGLWALHPDALDGSPVVFKAGAFVTTLVAFFANVPAVWIGDRLAQRISMKAVRMLAAALFILVGVLTLWSTFAPAWR